MSKTAIDDLAVIVSASTEQLGNDLRRAAAMVDRFAKEVERSSPNIGGLKSTSIDFSGVARAARAAGSRAANEFGKSFKQVKEAISLPTKAMIAGGSGAALADPFILATAAADGLAAAVEVPFKVAGAAAHAAAAIVPLPFQIAGAAIEGLTGMVGGLVPIVGGAIGGVGKIAGTFVSGLGTAIGGMVSGIGSALGVVGSAIGQTFGVTAKVAIQGFATTFSAVKEAVNIAAEVEQTKISFDVLIGSASKATEVLAGLRKFAAETPFSQRDVVGGGKQLAGYGISADQLIPSIKMLGEVSAATGKPLNELIYLYGTLINQDRAYIVDIKQFATAGIPIYQELAKVLHVTEDRTREMVEAGKVGIPEVQKAFINMTSAGGRFAGLMDKQSASFAGLREQLTDAFEVAKGKLGQAVIEEMGLKDAAKDITAFVKGLDSQIDRIRPAIRFVGDLGRSVASAGMQFAKAAGQFASIQFESIGRAFPEQFESIKRVLADLRDFKLDPENVTRASFEMARGIVVGLATALDWVETNGKQFAKEFKTDFVDPFKDLLAVVRDTVKAVRNFGNDFSNGVGVLKGWAADDEWSRGKKQEQQHFLAAGWKDSATVTAIMGDRSPAGDQRLRNTILPAVFGAADQGNELFGPRRDGESDKDFTGRYRALDKYIWMGHHLLDRGYNKAQPKLDELHRLRRENFFAPFSNDPDKESGKLHDSLLADKVPERRANYQPPAGVVASHRDGLLNMLNDLESRTLSGIRDQQAPKLAATSLFELVQAARDAKAGLSEVAGVTMRWSPGAEVAEVAKKAREEYGVDPKQKIANEFLALKKSAAIGVINTLGDLGMAGGYSNLPGGIDAGTYKRAAAGLGERADSLLGTHELPDAALKDTTESVRMMNRWAASQGRQTTESLLEQILDEMKKVNRHTADTADMLPNFAPIPQPLGQA